MAMLHRAALAASLLLVAPVAAAAPVEYVKVCSLYGADFFYVPGTDVCFDPFTGETRRQTENGTWIGQGPPNAGEFVPNAAAGCLGGTLVDLGTVEYADFSLDDYARMEADLGQQTLAADAFVSRVLVSGGLDVTPRASVCLAWLDDTGLYALLGCADTGPLADQAATWSFVPGRSAPPSAFVAPIHVVAVNANEDWGTDPFTGSVDVRLCVRSTQDTTDGGALTVVDNGDGTYTVSSDDGSTVTVHDGADGTDGVDGLDGAAGASCSVSQDAAGDTTITCPDGSTATISAVTTTSGGCDHTGGGPGLLGVALAAALASRRRR